MRNSIRNEIKAWNEHYTPLTDDDPLHIKFPYFGSSLKLGMILQLTNYHIPQDKPNFSELDSVNDFVKYFLKNGLTKPWEISNAEDFIISLSPNEEDKKG